MENNTGWIAIHRKLLEWEWYGDINVRLVFLHLLLKANHTTKKWKGETIERGSFITSLENLSKEIGITTQQTRTAITKLKSTNEITSKSTSHYTMICITNYDKYQGGRKDRNNKITNKITNEQQTDNKRITTTKNDNNVNNDNKRTSLSLLRDTELWEELSLKFNVNRLYIERECEKMEDWLKSKGKRQNDYRAFARNWIRRAMENNKDDKGFERRDAMLESTRELLSKYNK